MIAKSLKKVPYGSKFVFTLSTSKVKGINWSSYLFPTPIRVTYWS